MRKLVSCFLLVASVGVAVSAMNGLAPKGLDEAGNKFLAAFKRKDMAYLKSAITSDFKAVTKKKTYSRDEWIQTTNQLFGAVKIKTIDRSVLSTTVKGNAVVLKTKTSLEATITIPGQKKDSILKDVSLDNETWVKSGSGWKFKLDETINEKGTLNGKPIPGA